ncbi:hypothetical protein EJ06DRAFT_428343 [Trichodelitschia bisporula]|uniref:Uncharacterized protein n=1 Tax=Trichodelitschia bisporula TaxID=703511 RepID=A0A6G1HWR9_9PEZI|nr:hypothetical protein EJ06DRAFT_428343 [Trichodelitschia bisporula]
MAVILLVVVILSRWWRHHTRELDYHESQTGSSAELRPRNTSTTPDMFTRRRSFLPTAAAGFINRLSGGRQNRSSSPTLPQGAGERSFQKIHGRKLPSQFPSGLEEGPTSRDFEKGTPEVDTHQSVVSGSSSFYGRDSAAFFAAAASGHLSGPMPHPLFAPAVGVGAGTEPSLSGPPLNVDEIHEEAVRPGPARTPTFHSGGPQSSPYEPGPPPPVPVIAPEHRYHIQRNAPQPHRPGTNAAGALARNPPSTDSHGSRFSEDLPRIL